MFAMEYGLRIGEVCAIKRDALKDGRVYIKRAFSGNVLREKTKTGRVRNPEITPYAQEIIDGQKHFGEFLFVRPDDGLPYNDEILNRIWHKAEQASGIRIKLYNAVRHSLGCQMLDEGHDLSTVQEILGHQRPDMTRRYARRTAKRIGQILTMRRCGKIAVIEKSATYKTGSENVE
jgi:integrase